MDEHPNVAAVRRWSEKMESGDWEAMGDALSDDVEWHEIGRSEPTHGKAALMERMGQSWGDVTIDVKTHDILGNDEHVVQLVNVTAHRGDETFEYRTAEILHVRDGKVTARWAFSDDTARIMEFFGQG
jgi:ketosteroid isomerase-like protein